MLIAQALSALYAVKAAYGYRLWESDQRLLDQMIAALQSYSNWDK